MSRKDDRLTEADGQRLAEDLRRAAKSNTDAATFSIVPGPGFGKQVHPVMCEVCELPIPERAHQDPSARTCGPTCASTLFKRENPYWSHPSTNADEEVSDDASTPTRAR